MFFVLVFLWDIFGCVLFFLMDISVEIFYEMWMGFYGDFVRLLWGFYGI